MAAKQAKVPGGLVGVLPVADGDAPIVSEARKLGLTKLVVGTHESFEHLLPETTATWMASLQEKEGFTHWWAASTSAGKGLMPRLAGNLLRIGTVPEVVPISDIIQVVDERTFVRPIYAGNALTQVRSEGPCTIITVRSTSFPYTKEPIALSEETPMETISFSPPGKSPIGILCALSPSHTDRSQVDNTPLTEWKSEQSSPSDRPELTSAEIVVSGGRALKSADNFKLLYDLADVLGGAAGKDTMPGEPAIFS